MKYYMMILLTFFILGCSSDDDSTTNSINIWNYVTPAQSQQSSFDTLQKVDGVTTSTAIGSLTHEYIYINDTEGNGSWREYEGLYHYSNDGSSISFTPVEEDPNYDWESGSFHTNVALGNFLYRSNGDSGFSTTNSGVTSSIYINGGECVLFGEYESITLLNNYTYEDVIEVKCEDTRTQEYGESDSIQTVVGADIYYEYYQKDTGFIGKVNKNCIVDIVDSFEFIDDNNLSCVKTKTEYVLQSN